MRIFNQYLGGIGIGLLFVVQIIPMVQAQSEPAIPTVTSLETTTATSEENVDELEPMVTESEPTIARDVVFDQLTLTQARDEFVQLQETFLAQQTSQNKTVFDTHAVAYAKKLLDEMIKYTTSIEPTLYDAVFNPPSEVSQQWLSEQRTALRGIRTSLEEATTYAATRTDIGSALNIWETVQHRSSQMRVLAAYNNLMQLAEQVEVVRTRLLEEQSAVASDPRAAGIDWSSWQQLYDSYNEAVLLFQESVRQTRGEILAGEQFTTFDQTDPVWSERVNEYTDLVASLGAIQQLQREALAQLIQVVNQFSQIEPTPSVGP